MDLKEITALIDLINEKGITEFELEQEDFKLRICKQAPAAVAPAAQEAPLPASTRVQEATAEEALEEKALPQSKDNLYVIHSPMVGTFYRAPSPGAKPYVEIGDRVRKGQVCCIVEAMKLMNEIVIDVNGVVSDIHADNSQPVEYGEPLMTIEKTH